MDNHTLDMSKINIPGIRKIKQDTSSVLFDVNKLKIKDSMKLFLLKLAKL